MTKMENKNWRRDQTHLSLQPRISRAFEYIDEHEEYAGCALLLLAIGEDRQKMLLALKNNNNNKL